MEQSDNRMERVRGFLGLIAAPFTPMHGDGSINLQVIEQQAQSLLDHGVCAVPSSVGLQAKARR